MIIVFIIIINNKSNDNSSSSSSSNIIIVTLSICISINQSVQIKIIFIVSSSFHVSLDFQDGF